MANQKQVKILKKGTGAWNRWMNNNAGVYVDLSDIHLNGAKTLQIPRYLGVQVVIKRPPAIWHY